MTKAESFRDPANFSAAWLGRKLWEKQKQIARAVVKYPSTAVKGCHASGKTFVASGLPIHHIVAHKQSKCFITAPTDRQVKAFWDEISMARIGGPIAHLIPEPLQKELRIADDRYAIGASSNRGVNVQGMHSPKLLIIGDEGPGITPEVFEAIQGMRSGGDVHELYLGNPVVPVGEFYDMFGRHRSRFHCISISAFDTPNLQHETENRALTFEELLTMDEDRLNWCPFPFLIRRAWVKDRYLAWGPDHPKFRSRVMAEFPQQSPYSVFEMAWIEKAKREPSAAELEKALKLPIQIGIDVAGPGDDDTALCARVGGIILEQHAWSEADPFMQIMGVIHKLSRHPLYRLGHIVVDITGIGYHLARRIADAGFGNHVYGFNASQRAVDAEQFANGKSEAYFTARGYFKNGEISNLQDEECEAQLTTMLYRETPRGLTEIRSKDDMRKLGVPSPDRAEAMIFSLMRVVPRQVTVQTGSYQISPV